MLEWIEAHPGLAGWVQAFGTISALVIALAQPALQKSARQRATVVACRVPVRNLMLLLNQGYFPEGAVNRIPDQEFLVKLRMVVSDLRAIPAVQLPDNVLLLFHSLIEHLITAITYLEPQEKNLKYSMAGALLALDVLVEIAKKQPSMVSRKDAMDERDVFQSHVRNWVNSDEQ